MVRASVESTLSRTASIGIKELWRPVRVSTRDRIAFKEREKQGKSKKGFGTME